ncbi:acyl-CoA reductase [Pectobacterium carotovorum subsp. carotovorum]|nr:acyl-CoA reductase [Pectobacterium carotovorum subsp. carotovorum]
MAGLKMQNSEGVATLMQQEISDISYVVGNENTLKKMLDVPAMRIFDDKSITFLNALSTLLMKKAKGYSDVITFAFWCRRVSLLKEKNKYDDILERFGKGIVFHSTPSNVPVNFAFSFAAGLLAGNSNIIRLPAKEFPQVSVICDAINELASGEFSYIQPYVLMAKFPTVRAIIDSLSAIADARVIWGGDQTIANIRQSALKPRANEITFSDRHSILIINADFYLSVDDKARVVRDFYNDTYFSDQNACTSQHLSFGLEIISKQQRLIFGKELRVNLSETILFHLYRLLVNYLNPIKLRRVLM